MNSILLALILGVAPIGAPPTNVDGWNDIDRSAVAAVDEMTKQGHFFYDMSDAGTRGEIR